MENSEDFQVKELNKRASGNAYEVILSPSNSEAMGKFLLSPEKKLASPDVLKKKQKAAEERRKSREAEALKHFAEIREHEKHVLQKAIDERSNFSRTTQEKINQKMETNKENREAQMAVLNEKFKARDKKLEEAKKK